MTPGDQDDDTARGGTTGPGEVDPDADRDRATVARRVRVTGRVQGVFFRASTRSRARRRDLLGWVRNTPDGRVEAHVQGPAEQVDELVDWMREGGPSAARVSRVEVDEVEPITVEDFDVRR